MNFSIRNVSEPAEPVISLADAKGHLRVEHTADDGLITGLMKAAREFTEVEAQRCWLPRTVEVALLEFPCGSDPIQLPVAPVSVFTSLTYVDANGTARTLSGVQSWLPHHPPLLAPAPATSWPSTQAGKLAAVIITLTAGFANANAVPERAKAAMKLCLAHWYENRGDEKDPHVLAQSLGIPAAATRLLNQLGDLVYG